MISRRVFDEVGPFDGAFRTAGDFDWVARAVQRGKRLAVLPETLLIRRVHESNYSHRVADTRDALFRILRNAALRNREKGQTGAR